MMRSVTTCVVKDLGLIEYREAYQLQKKYVRDVIEGGSQVLLLCEHPPVLTLGRLTDRKNILVDEEDLTKRGINILPIDRGGDVTLHAPGQLVVYPILNLVHFGKDLRRYLFHLEQVAIDLLGDFDIVASRFPGQTGVWVKEDKIASIGIGVRKWISFHGLSINIHTDLSLFSLIRPCGLNVRMTSIEEIKGRKVDMAAAKLTIVKYFGRNFHLDFSKGEI